MQPLVKILERQIIWNTHWSVFCQHGFTDTQMVYTGVVGLILPRSIRVTVHTWCSMRAYLLCRETPKLHTLLSLGAAAHAQLPVAYRMGTYLSGVLHAGCNLVLQYTLQRGAQLGLCTCIFLTAWWVHMCAAMLWPWWKRERKEANT